jgi:hypothetical protein
MHSNRTTEEIHIERYLLSKLGCSIDFRLADGVVCILKEWSCGQDTKRQIDNDLRQYFNKETLWFNFYYEFEAWVIMLNRREHDRERIMRDKDE